jgi:hypothetical protein
MRASECKDYRTDLKEAHARFHPREQRSDKP